jgi:hypothetical protein
MSYNFKGNKYIGYRNAVDIAKEIRKDIKQAIKDGTLPSDLKVSVRSSYYAGGQSIDVKWSAPKTKLFTLACVCSGAYRGHAPSGECTTTNSRGWVQFYNLETTDVIDKTLQDITNAYNYDNSDVQSDYFERLYYGHADYDMYGAGVTAENLDYPLELSELIIGLWNGGKDRDLRDAYQQALLLTKLEVY